MSWMAGRAYDGPAEPGAQLSVIAFESRASCSDRLLDLALRATGLAREENLQSVSTRIQSGPKWPDVWPGEHYKLLAALVRVLAPKVVVEIGTYQGLSALTLAQNIPDGGAVHTFDVVPWREIDGQVLTDPDVEGGQIVPHLADLTHSEAFDAHRALLESAGLIFVDAAKDGRMERLFLERFETLRFVNDPIIVFDDIRVMNMIGIWSAITRPRLDLTSFGHWSGTGLIDWNGTARTSGS
jgi:predicted O-methyltransferase YrrM